MAYKPFRPSLVARGAGAIYGGIKSVVQGAESVGKKVVNSYLQGFADVEDANRKQGLGMIDKNFGGLNNYQKTLKQQKKKLF